MSFDSQILLKKKKKKKKKDHNIYRKSFRCILIWCLKIWMG